MAYTVTAQNGDTLCVIAKREGFGSCTTLRSHRNNRQLLDRPLHQGDTVTIPQPLDTRGAKFFFATFALFRRSVLVCALPQGDPQPKQVRFVRTGSDNPSDDDEIDDIGISTLQTNYADFEGARGHVWAGHGPRYRDYNADAFADPNCFNIDVVDPDFLGNEVEVRLEAMMPVYDGLGGVDRHERFPEEHREAPSRSLDVQLSRNPRNRQRFRSCYLRAVVDTADQRARPMQTILVTDLLDDLDVGDEHSEVKILDQNLRATYFDPGCTNDGDDRCIAAQIAIPFQRGRDVEVNVWILRQEPNGQTLSWPDEDDDGSGMVSFDDVVKRIHRNCRRIFAQQKISFKISLLEIVDPPSNMIAVADPGGSPASGQNDDGNARGKIGFTLHFRRFDDEGQDDAPIGPMNVNQGQTPEQTANQIKDAINEQEFDGLTVEVSVNPTIPDYNAGYTAGRSSADVILKYTHGRVTISHLTQATLQDADQKVVVVDIDINNIFIIRNQASNSFVGGGMQRNLFKSFDTDERNINLFVVNGITDKQDPVGLQDANILGLATSKHLRLPPQYRAIPAMANCIVIDGSDNENSGYCITGNCNRQYVILAHEFGHVLFDNLGHEKVRLLGQLMRQGVSWGYSTARGSFDNAPKRIADIETAYDVNKFIRRGSNERITEGRQNQLGLVAVDMNPVDMINASNIRKTHR